MEKETAIHNESGRTGKIVDVRNVPLLRDDGTMRYAKMYELSFPGQFWTECYFESEISFQEA